MIKEELQKYLKAFKKLRLDRSHGVAPHKPVLLLSVLQMVKKGGITGNRIYISPELISTFKTTWSQLVITNHICKMALPFFHMKSEGFWKLVPREGQHNALQAASSVGSIGVLSSMIDFSLLNEDLFQLMLNVETNLILTHFLLEEYFPVTGKNYSEGSYLQHISEIGNMILNESATAYSRETERLIAEGNDEEVFLRGGLFKKEVPRVYNNTCCISGYRVDALITVAMIDACHIKPFSTSYDDTISNGITLCPNLHRAFDRGLIAIDPNYTILVSGSFMENDHPFSMRQFEGKRILLPQQQKYWPALINLEWHYDKVFKR
jgi:putative restriction endonuclease